ncbi:unnamed protein product [Prunus armeniaca]
MQFIFVLSGWEGFAFNSRVLRDARPTGLSVPTGYYYLVDGGYTNNEGFLAPYRGTRYHLSEWREGNTRVNHQEYFNMKHAKARNVIERCFGLLKARWGILRGVKWAVPGRSGPFKLVPLMYLCRAVPADLIYRAVPCWPI